MVASKSTSLYRVVGLVRPVFKRLASAVELELEGTGVTLGMRAVMELLYGEPKLPVPVLARKLGLRRQSVQAVVDSMCHMQLVERRPNPTHLRSQLFVLTSKGRRQIERIRTNEQENLRHVAQALTLGDIRACERVLVHLERSFAEPSKWRGE